MGIIRTLTAAVMLACFSVNADASLILTIDDLGTAGVDVIVVDDFDGGIGTVTAKGSSNTADSFVGDGLISLFGPAGSFGLTISTGMSKPWIGPPAEIGLTSIALIGIGTLEITLTDTDFTDLVGDNLLFEIGGTTDGTVSVLSAGADNGNGDFVITNPVGMLGPFGPGDFSSSAIGSFVSGGLFSLSQTIRIVHTSVNDVTRFNSELSYVPEPGTLALLGLGLVGLGFTRRKKA